MCSARATAKARFEGSADVSGIKSSGLYNWMKATPVNLKDLLM
jgi:hypothetical protein